MPELPEVEIVRRSLFQKINRAKIINVIINNKNLRYKIPIDFSKKLKGQKILGINRRSKYLIFYFKKKNTFSSSWYEWKNVNYEKK